MDGPSPFETYEPDRLPHLVALLQGLPDAIAASSWLRSQVLHQQEDRLRALLRHAKAHSPWHAERLGTIDVETFRPADLPSLPAMTKADLMDHWDAIVTDPHLSLARTEAHLSRVAERGPAYLDGTYHALSSSGTSGRKSVVVWDFDGWLMQALASYAVVGKILLSATGEQVPLRAASVAGSCDASDYGRAVSACFASNMLHVDNISPLQPLDVTIGELNASQPTVLIGYPSMVEVLAQAAEAGSLTIAPRWIGMSGEPLRPALRELVERAFGVPVSESWGSTETGPLAFGPLGRPLRLDESVAVVEPVTETHDTCRAGERSATVLVTNLVNKALPLIRYDLGDEVVLEEPGPGDAVGGPVLSEVCGRRYETFVYAGGVVVHPAMLEHVLNNDPAIVAYQVQQTSSGVHVRYRSSDAHDDHELAPRLRSEVAGLLASAGLSRAEVRLEGVETIDRSTAGKVQRFVRLEGGSRGDDRR